MNLLATLFYTAALAPLIVVSWRAAAMANRRRDVGDGYVFVLAGTVSLSALAAAVLLLLGLILT